MVPEEAPSDLDKKHDRDLFLNVIGQTNDNMRSEATSPFTRITNDLEALVSQLDEETEVSMTYRALPPTANPRSSSTEKMVGKRQSKKNAPSVESTLHAETLASRSLWIGNVDPTVSEREVRSTFEPIGPIESLRMLPSKECAFVNFFNLDDAIKAKETLQGSAIGNMIIRIGFGKEEFYHPGNGSTDSSSKPTPPSTGTNGVDGPNHSRSVWVGHIGPEVDVEMLNEAFMVYGEIDSCRILDVKNCAFVNFVYADDAGRARSQMNGATVGSSLIRTGYAKSASSINANGQPSRSEGGENVYKTAKKPAGLYGRFEDDSDVIMSTKEVGPDDYKVPLPPLPADVQLPDELNINVIRECRRRLEHSNTTTEDIDGFADKTMEHMLAAAVDPIGNILVQKLIEKGSDQTRLRIIEQIGVCMATVGVHKNGTWVIQRIINNCHLPEHQQRIVELIRPHTIPLLQDQFGNYVVQCCLNFGPKYNQFIFDAMYHRCVEIATSRFGSRALRSCLESLTTTERQKKFVAMALISHALTLVLDQNGVIAIQWFLDSDLPGRHTFIAPVLKGQYAVLCLSKHASCVVAKLVHPSVEASARELVIEELFTCSSLGTLLQEPLSSAILLRCLSTARPEQKIRLAYLLEPHLTRLHRAENLSHLQKIREEVDAAREFVQLEQHTSASTISNVLLSHAVGGPVSNSSIMKVSGSSWKSETSHDPPISSKSMLSFGTIKAPIIQVQNGSFPSSPPSSERREATERLSFGPNLIKRVEPLQIDRPQNQG